MKTIKRGKDVLLKVYRAEVKVAEDDETVFEATVSTASRDRDNEGILGSAWAKRLKEYRKYPVLLTSHDYRKLTNVIGEVERVTPTEDGLKIRHRYFSGQGNEEADWAEHLARKGLAAFSVGFMVFDYKEGDGVKEPQRIYTDVELLEISQVTIPANRDALIAARAKGLDPLMDEIAKALELEVEVDPKTEDPAPQPPATAAQPPAEDPGPEQKAEESWKVGGARNLPLLDDDSWDGSAAAAACFSWATDDGEIDWAKARKGFVVYNPADPEKKGSYKLPFAKVEDGALKASTKGLQAVRQRLSATDIPDEVKKAAERFVDGYLGKQEAAAEPSVTKGPLADYMHAQEQESEVWQEIWQWGGPADKLYGLASALIGACVQMRGGDEAANGKMADAMLADFVDMAKPECLKILAMADGEMEKLAARRVAVLKTLVPHDTKDENDEINLEAIDPDALRAELTSKTPGPAAPADATNPDELSDEQIKMLVQTLSQTIQQTVREELDRALGVVK